MIGQTLGTYRIEEKLGQGGMGVVYRATDTELERPVAVKTLLTQDPDPELTARFVREAKVASKLQHPSITTVYQVGVEGNTRYIVMEFVEGRTLRKIMAGSALPVNQACEIAIQIADGLAAAHERGIVHRDLKAENIMITPRQQVKILDFGLAKSISHDSANNLSLYQTQAGALIGTISYMAPEQAMGSDVNSAADVFSFGVLLYEMTTGQMPFAGPNASATLARILNQDPTPITMINPQLPADLDALIRECLRKQPAQRPPAAEIMRRLKQIQASLSTHSLISQEIRDMVTTISTTQAISAVDPTIASTPAVDGSAVARMVQLSQTRPSSTSSSSSASSLHKATASEIRPPVRGGKYIYFAARALRWAISLAMYSVPLSYVIYFLIGGGVIRSELLEGISVYHYIQSLVAASLSLADKIFAFRAVVNAWNFMLLGLAAGALLLRAVIMIPVDMAEQWVKSKFAPAKRLSASGTDAAALLSGETRSASHRLSKLREYAQAKQYLSQEKQYLSFLSIDVVGSTKMKVGEDKLAIEHAFAEYKKFVERILNQNNVWKVAWTPDGTMCAFKSLDEAVKSGQEVLKQLSWFNNGIHHLKTAFNVRCGVNAGEVIFPAEKAMEEISDEVIDVAGHMQKYAAPGSLWMAEQLLSQAKKEGFHPLTSQQVDGQKPFEWRPESGAEASARGASAQ